MMRSRLLGGSLGVCTAAVALAQFQPRLVNDFRTIAFTSSGQPPESRPLYPGSNGSIAVFMAADALHGREFWATDGTQAGTRLIADFGPRTSGVFETAPSGFWQAAYPGPRGSFMLLTKSNSQIRLWKWHPDDAVPTLLLDGQHPASSFEATYMPGALANDLFFFVVSRATQPLHTKLLWVTDGTAAGTRMLRDFGYPGVSLLSAAGSHVYFVQNRSMALPILWVSDGTAAGTFELTDRAVNGPVVPLGSLAYFVGRTEATGTELWVTDGTTAGTRLAADIVPGATGSNPTELVPALGGICFYTQAAGAEGVYRLTDPSVAPVRIDHDFGGISNDGLPSLIPSRELLFVRRGRALSRTDGTPSGSFALNNLSIAEYAAVTPFTNSAGGGMVFFPAYGPDGRILACVSDGTLAGTVSLDTGNALFADARPLGAVTGGFVFSFNSPSSGREPWFTDGTPSGTRLLRDVNTTVQGSYPRDLFQADRQTFVTASADSAGLERFRTDGINTTPCEETVTGAGSFTREASTVIGSRVFARTFEPTPSGPRWRVRAASDPQSVGAVVAEIPTENNSSGDPHGIGMFSQAGEICVFRALAPGLFGPIDTCVWRSDGTPEGTFPITPFAVGSPVAITRIVTLGSASIVVGQQSDGDSNPRGGIFATDGNSTRLLHDLGPATFGFPNWARSGDSLFVQCNTEGSTAQLFLISPSAATFEVTPLTFAPGGNFDSSGLVVLGSRALFVRGSSIWYSDGTPATTAELFPLAASQLFSGSRLTVANDPAGVPVAYFTDSTLETGRELWLTDGTAAGTRMVVDLWPGPASSEPGLLTAVDGHLFFTANRGDTGYELWTSDGTAAGTTLVADIVPGPASAGITFLKASGGRLYFDPVAPDIGRELWTVYVSGRYCDADHNADGEVNADDLDDYINCYFALPPCEDLDFNRDGDPNADDLADYINAFFAGCA